MTFSFDEKANLNSFGSLYHKIHIYKALDPNEHSYDHLGYVFVEIFFHIVHIDASTCVFREELTCDDLNCADF